MNFQLHQRDTVCPRCYDRPHLSVSYCLHGGGAGGPKYWILTSFLRHSAPTSPQEGRPQSQLHNQRMKFNMKCKICQTILFNKYKSRSLDTYQEQTIQQIGLAKNASVKANPNENENENDHDHDGHGFHGYEMSESDHHLPDHKIVYTSKDISCHGKNKEMNGTNAKIIVSITVPKAWGNW